MNFFTTKISNDFQQELKQKLLQAGFTVSEVQNALWKASSNGVVVTCYASLKLLVQGKSCSEFVSVYFNELAPQTEQTTFISDEFKHDFPCWVGTDESGKGDYFGPLVTAGVLVREEQTDFLIGLNIKDSKKLDDKLILKLAPKIKETCVYSVVTINPGKYNELYARFNNLNKLLAWAHARAIENVLDKAPECENAICDKFANESLIKNALFENGEKINVIQRTKAESDIAVACASVLAREEFVLRMQKLSQSYGIDFAKGGGEIPTKQAKEFVEKYGKDELKYIAKLHFKNTMKL